MLFLFIRASYKCNGVALIPRLSFLPKHNHDLPTCLPGWPRSSNLVMTCKPVHSPRSYILRRPKSLIRVRI